MDAAGLLQQLRERAARRGEVEAPPRPGVYAWFLNDPAALPALPDQGEDPIYVGLSSNLAQREFDTHFRAGQTGFSTLRRSLGALLKAELDLRAQPRGTGASDTNYRCYRFDDVGEERLSEWMQEHLRVAVQEHPSPGALEEELISLAEPPLNLTRWANPAASAIKALRKACVEEGRRNFPFPLRATPRSLSA